MHTVGVVAGLKQFTTSLKRAGTAQNDPLHTVSVCPHCHLREFFRGFKTSATDLKGDLLPSHMNISSGNALENCC